jgi:hypothetical protein
MTRLLPGLESGRINPFAVIADLQEEGAVGSSNCLCPDAATPHCLTVRREREHDDRLTKELRTFSYRGSVPSSSTA